MQPRLRYVFSFGCEAFVHSVTFFKLVLLYFYPAISIKQASVGRVSMESVGFADQLGNSFFILKLLTTPFVGLGLTMPAAISLISLISVYTVQIGLVRQIRSVERVNTLTIHLKLLCMIVLVAPAVHYFSIVALRDALLFLTIVIVLKLLAQRVAISKRRWAQILVFAAAGCLMRPEVVIIFGLFAFFLYITKNNLRTLSALFMSPVLAIAGMSIGAFVLNFAFDQSANDLIWLISETRDSRFYRQFLSNGSGSAIALETTWTNLSFFEKTGLQWFGFALMPLSLATWSYFSVAVDSVVLCIGVFLMLTINKTEDRFKFKWPFILTYLMSFLTIALLVVNFGNAFRIRLMLWAILVAFVWVVVAKKAIGIDAILHRSQERH